MKLQNFSLNRKKKTNPKTGGIFIQCYWDIAYVGCVFIKFWLCSIFVIVVKLTMEKKGQIYSAFDIEWQQNEANSEGGTIKSIELSARARPTRATSFIRIESIHYLMLVLHKFSAIHWVYRSELHWIFKKQTIII